MTDLETLVGSLYPKAKDEVLNSIGHIKKRYPLNAVERVLSEKDIILIAYGDSILKNRTSPLQALKQFCDTYLREGISAVHVLPCFPYSSDDGFSVIDYYTVNPDLGSWKDIEQLSEHFDLMFDAVVNHMSKHADWFRSFLNGDAPYNTYFVTANPKLDYSKVVRPRALPLLHTYNAKEGQVHVWTTFSEDQVDLNYKSPEVFLQVLDILLYYVSKGARFIRLDAIAFLWKEMGTSCIHLPETHRVIQAYRNILDSVVPGTILITETNVPHKENISYFGNGHNEAHMVYNFTLPPLLAHTLHCEDVTLLTDWAGSLELPGKTCFFNFTASHDGVGVRPLQGIVSDESIRYLAKKAEEHGGFVSYKDNGDGTQSPYELNCNYLDLLTHPKASEELRIQRFLLTQSVMLCMPGVPGIYYHSLLGSGNDVAAAEKSGINRRINRAKLTLDGLEVELKDSNSFRSKIFSEYSKMLQIRSGEPLFDPYVPARFFHEDGVFYIERKKDGKILRCVHNFSSNEHGLSAINEETKMIYFGGNLVAKGLLGPFQFCWYKLAET
ncbi:MAG: sugar phosphorylase [Bacteroidota bacterium]